MEFLKAILGDELYSQVEQAINAHNGKPENKDKQMKLADLGSGEYVSKGKHSTLEAENQTNITKLAEANNLIAQLQKAAKGDETLQAQVTAYQTKVQELEAELAKTKTDTEARFGLISAGCKPDDVDYIIFKLQEEGKLELDENGKIKGWDDKVAGAKTRFPTHFDSTQKKTIIPNVLNPGDPAPLTVTKEQFLQMGYNDRLKLKQENEQLYRQLTK